MFVSRSQISVFGWVGMPALVAIFALAGAASAVLAQSSDLPSSPTPNPSSFSNPYYGSVTLSPATDGVLKLSLDDAVNRGLGTNLGLKESEAGEIKFRGEVTEAVQYFLPSITVSGATGYNEFNLAAFGFTSGFLGKVARSGIFPPNAFNGFSFITKADVTTGQINYEQTLFSGTYIDGYKAVRAAETSAYFGKMSARGEVVQQVATAYLAVIAAQSEVDNAKSLMDAVAGNKSGRVEPFAELLANNARFAIAVRGWIGFVEQVSIDWCVEPRLPRDELRDLLSQILFAIIGAIAPQILRLA